MHELARWLQERHWSPQQTQCFIPTPGSIATAMYYCGRNEDGEEIYVARSDADRLRQHRILMPDFGRMPERGGHADAEDAGEGHHREPRRETPPSAGATNAAALTVWPPGTRAAATSGKTASRLSPASMTSGRVPRRDFRHPDRDGFRKPGFRQDADKPFRPRPFPDAARDGDEAPQARPSFRRDGQDERPFRPRGDRFVDRDGEEARRPFRPRRDDDGQPFRKDGFRPRRFNDRDGNEGQDAWKRPRPFARFDDEQEGAPCRDFRRPDRDGFRKPGFRQDADKPFRPRPFPDASRDGDEAPQARPSFRRDGQDERPFRPRGDRFVDRDGEEARRPFRPRHDDEGRPFRKDGFRPRRFNDRDGNEGQDGKKRRAPFPRFDDEREGAPVATSAVPSVTASASPVSGRMPTSPSARTRSAGTASPPSAPAAGTGALTARR